MSSANLRWFSFLPFTFTPSSDHSLFVFGLYPAPARSAARHRFLHFVRSSHSFSFAPTSFMSLLITSLNLSFCLPPLLLPVTLANQTDFKCSSGLLLITCPCHLNLASLALRVIFVTFMNRRMSSFVLCSCKDIPPIHLSILISTLSNSLSSALFRGSTSRPYSNTGWITLLYILILSFSGIFLSHTIPLTSLHFIHAL